MSVKGATRAQRWVSTEKLWRWIDANGKDFGIGRPYLDRDPPHVAPIDGKEYVSRRGSAKTEVAEAKGKKTEVAEKKAVNSTRHAAPDDRSKAKHGKTVRIAKGAKVAKTVKLARARTM